MSPTAARGTLVAATLAAWLPALACAPGGAPPATQSSASPEPSLAAPVDSTGQGPLEFGDWAVIGNRTPGTSAMSEAEAEAWIGRVARYGADLAAFGAETCYHPSYQARAVRGDSLLQVAYHATPSALGLAPRSMVTLIEIRCGESPWIGPGGTLLSLSDSTTYLVWDGTFFELRRRAPQGGS